MIAELENQTCVDFVVKLMLVLAHLKRIFERILVGFKVFVLLIFWDIFNAFLIN